MKILFISILFIQLLIADKQDDPAFKTYYKAYEFVLNEEWKNAISQFEIVIKDYPKSDYLDESYFWIAYSTKEQGEHEQAINLYSDFIKNYQASNLVDQAISNRSAVARLLVKNGKKEFEKFIEGSSSRNERRDRAERRRERDEEREDAEEEEEEEPEEEDYDEDDESYSDRDELVEASIQALANQGGKDSASKLRKIIESKKYSRRVREKAIFWYGQTRAASLDELLALFNKLTDKRLKEKCIFSISQYENKRSTEVLMQIALDDSQTSSIREKAIFWIGNSHASSSSSFEKLLKEIKETRLREKLMFSISQSGLKNNGKILREIALDKNESNRVREKAIFWLGNNSRSVEDLKKLYASISEERLQEKLIFAFHQSSSEEAIDYMIKLLKMDSTSTRIKKKIIFWLGQSNSSKARKAISDLLD